MSLQILLNSLLYGITASILSLTARELRFYNLAAGSWIVTGGWWFAWITSETTGLGIPVTRYWFLALAPLAVLAVQTGAPLAIGKRLKTHPFTYIFISLGIALTINHAVPAYALTYDRAIIPGIDTALDLGWTYVAVVLGIGTLIIYITRSRLWSRVAIGIRLDTPSNHIWHSTAFLVFVEIGLLLIVGAASTFIHNGLYESAEYRTVIPLLALLAVRGKPIKAGFLATVVVLVSSVLLINASSVGGLDMSHYSEALSITGLIPFTVYRRWKFKPFLTARVSKAVPEPIQNWSLNITSTGWRRVFESSASLLLLAIAYIMSHRLEAFSTLAFWKASYIFGVSLLAWAAYRSLDTLTIGWIFLGALSAYVVHFNSSSPGWLAGITILLLGIYASYLLLIRVLPVEAALVTDLSVFSAVYISLKSTPSIVGTEGTLLFEVGILSGIDTSVILLSVLLGLGLILAVSIAGDYPGTGRSIELGLANFRLAYQHGIQFRRWFGFISIVLAFATAVMASVFYHHHEAIFIESYPISYALAVLLFGFLMRSTNVVYGTVAVLCIFWVLPSIFVGAGPISILALGVLFSILPFLTKFEQ
jgi:uncharacterized membrane protein